VKWSSRTTTTRRVSWSIILESNLVPYSQILHIIHDEVYFISYQGQLVKYHPFKGTHSVLFADKTFEYLASHDNCLVGLTKARELMVVLPDNRTTFQNISSRHLGTPVKVAVSKKHILLVLWEEEMKRGKYVLLDRELKFLDETFILMSKTMPHLS
jgi:hypothetical protein